MIKTTSILLDEYSNYSSPNKKIENLVKKNNLFPIIRGLYETNDNIRIFYLAESICGPSYISFESALSYYGLIPEAVYTCTSATFKKNKHKKFFTNFGTFTYQDIPSKVFFLGVKIIEENGYSFKIASKEKALCDTLYIKPPIKNFKDISTFLFSDLRIDEDEFLRLNKKDILKIASYYKSKNVKALIKYIGE